MNNLISIVAPLVAFFVTYRWRGIYAATAVLMALMVLTCALEYLRFRKVSGMQLLSTALVLALGGATLSLRDPRFLKWKPSIFLWLLAAAFLFSHWVGRMPIAQRMLQPALPEGTVLPPGSWQRLNFQWVAAYAVLGGANWWVAFHWSEAAWVNFKVFGLTAATMLVAVGQAWWLNRHVKPAAGS
jgi:intracellular septation protein